MKVLFSTDWHLGYAMGGANPVDRLPDQVRQLGLIARYIDENDVDVLAIAGDVFESQERSRARVAVQAMMTALGRALDRGLQVVMIAGNHDRDYFMEMANEWLGARRESGSDRIVLCTRPRVLTVAAKGERVNFVLLPFPTPARYAMDDLDDSGGAGARNERIVQRFVATMESLREQASADRLPTVLLTHLTVEGTEVGPHRLAPRDDIVVPRSTFPSFEMTVVGHIHKPEQLGSSHFYYAGVLDRMDYGELLYEPRVLLADIGPAGLRGEPESLLLDPTPFAAVDAENEEDLRRAHRYLKEPEKTLVKLHLRVPYGTYTAPLIAAARELFPRLYGNVEHEWVGVPVVEPSVSGLDPTDVLGTVQRYFETQVPDEKERAELLELVDELRVAAGDEW